MKFLASFLLLAVALTVAVDALPRPPKIPRPRPNKLNFPTFPGYGPFNPRGRRSAEDRGQISIHGQKEGGKTSWSVEGQHKVWGNDNGSIHISGGANKQPGGKPQGTIGIGGSFHWGK